MVWVCTPMNSPYKCLGPIGFMCWGWFLILKTENKLNRQGGITRVNRLELQSLFAEPSSTVFVVVPAVVAVASLIV